jgi:arylsulfatase A-like enzyme
LKTSSRHLVLCATLGLGACGGGSSTPSSSLAPRAKPNIIFVLTDDMDMASLPHLTKLGSLMSSAGVSFSNSFASDPVCCPSRASTLRGQYTHNHGIWTNGRGFNSCFDDFRLAGMESSTVATWLQGAGYRTGLLGKYLNKYPAKRDGTFDETYVPPGWDVWFAVVNTDVDSGAYYQYQVNDSKTVISFGTRTQDYETDVLSGRAVDFINGNAAAGGRPFFLWIATAAPHADPVPARRYDGSEADQQAPRTPNFNEDDISDKPRWYRDNLPPLSSSDVDDVDDLFRKRLETLHSVEDLIQNVVDALRTNGLLENTYLFFTSDNGFMVGNHRFPTGKDAPYEESIRVPLIVRGPGLPQGVALPHTVSNIDLAPTFADIAQASVPGFVDGRSLLPLFQPASPPVSSWRQDILIEHQPGDVAGLPSWFALRNDREIYIDYPANAEDEYYDLVHDPFELVSKNGLDPSRRTQLRARLQKLEDCAGASCRQ